jgi:hypothetical protein
MDSFTQYQQRVRKLFASTANLMLPDHRLLTIRTVDIGTDSVKVIIPENLPERLDCMLRLSIPANQVGFHAVIAHVKTQPSVFDGRHGGFLTTLRFTSIPAGSVRVIEGFLKV